jgi:aldehyde dehydrogenase (NAD+)
VRDQDWLWMGGSRARAQGDRRITVVSPSTEEPVGEVTAASAADVDLAVRAAHAALRQGEWARASTEERISVLLRARAMIEARSEELARLQTEQMGAPLRMSRHSAAKSLANLDSNIAAARALPMDFLVDDREGPTLVTRKPVGLVAAIVPWNSPLQFEVDKVAAALLAGCPVVLKPAPETPFEAFVLAEVLADAGLPAGMLSVLPGDGPVGQLLVEHPGVARVSFTGSSATGRVIGSICGGHLKRVGLELGGKSAAVVLDDADVDNAALTIAKSNYGNSGQGCHIVTRALVPRGLHRQFVDAVIGYAENLVVGDPWQEETEMGPLVARRQRDRVERYLASARQEGATLATGGGRPAGLPRGWYVQPTVLTDVKNSMTVAREEIFGPVLSVIEYGDVPEAIEIANDSEFGLGGSVFTEDLARGTEVARAIETGMVAVNSWGMTRSAPFGGVKGSGIGREHGLWGVAESLEIQAIRVSPAEAERLAGNGVGRSPALI